MATPNMTTPARVKVCGITTPEDAVVAQQAGADAIGLVFYEKSPRHIADLGLAYDIAQSVGPFVSVVALTVNEPARRIDEILTKVPVSVLQFHGDETAEHCSQFHHPYLKALRMEQDVNVEAFISEYHSSSGILLDAYVKGVPGGTGQTFNWDLVPASPGKPIILAGGLNLNNIGQAIDAVQPYGVDVSGGVESSPGKKDHAKIHAFIKNAKWEHVCDKQD